MGHPQPFPLIEISGKPYERGKMYGAACPERIRRSVNIYTEQLGGLGIDSPALSGLVAEFFPDMEAYSTDSVEEMRGIAAGAGLSFEEIVLVNARTEIVSLSKRRAGLSDDDPDGCTGAVILPGRSSSGKLIHGQNWDWRAACAETAVVLRIVKRNGPDLLTFTEAGALARCGFNAAGIAITANYLESDRDYRQKGIPLPLIRRFVLEQEHVALAMRSIYVTPKACSNNMIVSHHQGWAIDFECAPDETFPVYPKNDLIVHANHWLSPVALSKLKDTGIPSTPESFYRDWRVRCALESKDKVTADDLKSALFDDFGTPYSVCRPPRPGSSGNLTATVAMVIMEPESGWLEATPLPAMNRESVRYELPSAIK